jgi:hypothetical protein
MKHVKRFGTFIAESIRAEEAYNDKSALQTVVDGKRDLGFMTIIGSTLDKEVFWSTVKEHGLKTLPVKGSQHQAYIYFRKGADEKAKELRDIAEKYGGYLAWNATEEDTRRIGELLSYDKKDIDSFIKKNYK